MAWLDPIPATSRATSSRPGALLKLVSVHVGTYYKQTRPRTHLQALHHENQSCGELCALLYHGVLNIQPRNATNCTLQNIVKSYSGVCIALIKGHRPIAILDELCRNNS